jgi:hypothetical protein
MHRLFKLAIAAVALAPLAASARSSYLTTFNSTYHTAGTALDGCGTCHGSGGTSTFNPYGGDVRANIGAGISSALKAVEPLDSDNDGFTNLDEIQSLSLPGDPRSVPAPTTLPPTAFNADVSRFAVAKRLDLSRGLTTAPAVTVLNSGTTAGNVTVGVQGVLTDAAGQASNAYSASQTVSNLAGGASQKIVFPTFTPSAAGTITWTVTLSNDPDTATAATKIVP